MPDFTVYGIPSPVRSTNSPAPTYTGAPLPTQRQHPLKPGSPKEIALINYVDDKVLYITRRYATKFTDIKTKAVEAPGYTSFDQFIADLNPLIDLVWATGTSLQTPYMLQFAGMVASYMTSFPFTTEMFGLLGRLDEAFSSLLEEHNHTNDHRHSVSMTEKVRIKSLVEETRVVAVRQASSAGVVNESDVVGEGSNSRNNAAPDTGNVNEVVDDDDDELDDDSDSNEMKAAMAIAKIYVSTMNILGDSLGPSAPEPQTDDADMDLS